MNKRLQKEISFENGNLPLHPFYDFEFYFHEKNGQTLFF